MTNDVSSVEERVMRLARDAAGRVDDDLEIDRDTPLLDLGVIDSLTVAEFVAMVEEEYGVSVPFSELVPVNFASVRSLTDLVDRLAGAPTVSERVVEEPPDQLTAAPRIVQPRIVAAGHLLQAGTADLGDACAAVGR